MNRAALENIRKFSAMSNAEAYVEAFHNRLMRPLPDSDVTGEYWGSTTRLDFYPLLREALAELSCNRDVRILDVGAGSGEMVDHVLKDYPAAISPVEPNALMLDRYLEALKRHPNVVAETSYRGTVQSLYEGELGASWLNKLDPFDFVLASHMIYGLTSATSNDDVTPALDLTKFLTAMYEKLADDGVLFLVYAIGENTLFGENAAYCLSHVSPAFERNVRNIWRARTELLEHHGAQKRLNALFPDHDCEMRTVRLTSLVYGDTMDDIASYCILGELTQIDDGPFDTEKMQHIYNFIEARGARFNTGEIIGGFRDGMVTVETPQVVCLIKKHSKD